MRIFAAVGGYMLLAIALIPSVLAASVALGFKAMLHLLTWFVANKPEHVVVTGNSGPPAAAFHFEEAMPSEVAYASAAVLVLSAILLFAYVPLALGVILRWRRVTAWIGLAAIAIQFYFLVTTIRFAWSARFTLNDHPMPGMPAYPALSIVVIAALICLSGRRLKNEPPPLRVDEACRPA